MGRATVGFLGPIGVCLKILATHFLAYSQLNNFTEIDLLFLFLYFCHNIIFDDLLEMSELAFKQSCGNPYFYELTNGVGLCYLYHKF